MGQSFDQDPLFVLAGMPPSLHAVLGEANLRRLGMAHPQVRVERVDEPEHFTARVPEADGVIVWPAFGLPEAALQPGSRLRWVQSVPAGVDNLLTPALLAADH